MKYMWQLLGMPILIALFALSACSAKEAPPQETNKLDVEAAIIDYISEHTSTDCKNILDEVEKPVTVLITNETAHVTARALWDFCIPAVAEELVPVAMDALEENGVTLDRISITYYRTNHDGVVDGSLVDWTTKDGERGTFTSETDSVVKPGYTIVDLLEYYVDAQEMVERLKTGEP